VSFKEVEELPASVRGADGFGSNGGFAAASANGKGRTP
jgi:hypothetical protein